MRALRTCPVDTAGSQAAQLPGCCARASAPLLLPPVARPANSRELLGMLHRKNGVNLCQEFRKLYIESEAQKNVDCWLKVARAVRASAAPPVSTHSKDNDQSIPKKIQRSHKDIKDSNDTQKRVKITRAIDNERTPESTAATTRFQREKYSKAHT